ncbi:gamma-glutamyltransferase [Pelagibius sp. Alg239-R121]|uniref:gamma-glutamyltransferase n=1 Tax=Pelagibius sp. Alg239-R121 TaxID=2993448 RepID=UPI0024A61906|nr:gamma-glutamyltransferase [Pelagibius sp. Alg239-R121]
MTHGIVSAPQPEAVEAGTEALERGGNAIDAAIATALVQTVVDPQMCGIAGFGSMQLYLPDQGIHTCLDFHGRAPSKVTPEMWQDRILGEAEDGFGFILEGHVNDVGYGAVTTPMSLKAYDEALTKFGTMTLSDLMEPAIAYAEEGFMVRPHVSYFWNLVEGGGRAPHGDRVTKHPEARRIYVKDDGKLRKPGEILRNPDMAATYRQIAAEGVESFYQGTIAERIVSDMEANDGYLTHDDLRSVAVNEVAPLWGEYRGHKIATNNPPGGGIMVLEMLNILENFDLAAMGHDSPDYIATVSEAMKIATADKDRSVGDPRFVEIPVDRLISKTYAREMAAKIRSGEKTSVPRLNSGGKESTDTTHISVADEYGNCVAMTHSLGMPSGVVTPGLGFMYNGCMSVFDPRPGNTGSLAPGKSRFTAMAPTMVFKGDEPFFVVGAPGGTFITMGVLQAILNVVDFGMNAQEAVSAPRFCTTSDTIDITNRITRRTERELKARGYPVRRSPLGYHFAGVHALRKTEAGWDGGADPARDGVALAV